ncbi:hypothetical protein NDU88_001733 [Pleurodeles waltl]|uniref:Reverse transcriptase/retrotransposon-derived protein RNase H-like domain-containing protein n=1 Tax=Pleurodeles waltl TaxID=8319 RepID=A0AAV7PDD3_PLEWA|nr:hypothetical protein NDU88_001733 [Pleurodeles waltl]
MVTYCRVFILNLRTLTKPLRILLKAKVASEWTEEWTENVFENTKGALSTEPTMNFYDPTKPTKLVIDAIQTGLGALSLRFQERAMSTSHYKSKAVTSTDYAALKLKWKP